LERFGGSDVTVVDHAGRISRVFKPWLNDAIQSDREEIGKIIDSAIKEGTPLKQVEQALDEVFAMREHNAKLTAYQETKALYNQGTMDRFEEEGVQRGIWHHMDPQQNPREEHQELDGQIFDLDDPVWDLMNEPNCRCWCEPVTGLMVNNIQARSNEPRVSIGSAPPRDPQAGDIWVQP
jgi:SPP1 gp7 family putative phage head morphogenesis protein